MCPTADEETNGHGVDGNTNGVNGTGVNGSCE
jgi:hypothetical protein